MGVRAARANGSGKEIIWSFVNKENYVTLSQNMATPHAVTDL